MRPSTYRLKQLFKMVRKAVKRDDGIDEAKSLICEMCRNFYNQGWVSGTGGGMSIKATYYAFDH